MQEVKFEYHHINHFKFQNQSKKTLILSIIVTTFFAFLELFGGIVSQSLALISDSMHMFSDVLALLLSMIAIYYSTKKSNKRYTYGYLRIEIIAAFLNGLALFIISLSMIYEAIMRVINPVEINFKVMITIAIVGLIVNVVLTLILMNSLKYEDNLNIKSAMWHFLGDLINSIGVIITALVIKFTGLLIFDALISIIISIIIMLGGIKIIKESLHILMEGSPKNLDIEKIHQEILKIENIKEVHEFHLWSISQKQYILSFHVILNDYDKKENYELINKLSNMLKEKFGIYHVTIQIEKLDINIHEELDEY